VNSSGAAGIIVWIGIALSYARLRSRPDSALAALPVARRRGLGVAAWIVSIAMTGMLVGMVFLPSTRVQLLMTMLPVMVIFVVVLWRETNVSADPEW
jgi:L-asparagine transporter-like permease